MTIRLFSFLGCLLFLASNLFAIDAQKLEEWKTSLQEFSVLADGTNTNHMSREAREQGLKIVRDYYSFLKDNNEKYGEAALKVVNDEGLFGKIANLHLRTQAVFDGKKRDYLPELRDRIVISLAFRDINKRIEEGDAFGYASISRYHKEVFLSQGLSEYAWGGLAVEELLGSGKWMAFFDADVKIFSGVIGQLSQIKEKRNGYAVDRLVTSLKHSFSCYLTFEHDYQPMIRAGSPEEAASWFDVDAERVIAIKDPLSVLEPSMISHAYKILPMQQEEKDKSSSSYRQNRCAKIMKKYTQKIDDTYNTFVKSKCAEAKSLAECLNKDNNEKIKAFREQKQSELDQAKLQLEAELVAESKAKSAAVRASLAGQNVTVVVDNFDIRAVKQEEFNAKVADIKAEISAYNKKINEQGQILGQQNDQRLKGQIDSKRQTIFEKKKQFIEAVKQMLKEDRENIEMDIEELGKDIVKDISME